MNQDLIYVLRLLDRHSRGELGAATDETVTATIRIALGACPICAGAYKRTSARAAEDEDTRSPYKDKR